MTDSPASGFVSAALTGTTATVVGVALVGEPMRSFARQFRTALEARTSMYRFARDTSVKGLFADGPAVGMRRGFPAGIAFGGFETVHAQLATSSSSGNEDLAVVKFGKAALAGVVGGAMEGAIIAALRETSPAGVETAAALAAAPSMPRLAAVRMLYRALFFGIDAVTVSTLEQRELRVHNGATLWIPRFVAGYYTSLIASVAALPLMNVVREAEASRAPSMKVAFNALVKREGIFAGLLNGAQLNAVWRLGGAATLVVYHALKDRAERL